MAGNFDGVPGGEVAVDLLLEGHQFFANTANLLPAVPGTLRLQFGQGVLQNVDRFLERQSVSRHDHGSLFAVGLNSLRQLSLPSTYAFRGGFGCSSLNTLIVRSFMSTSWKSRGRSSLLFASMRR